MFILILKEEQVVIIRHRLIQHQDHLHQLEEVRRVFTSRHPAVVIILETIPDHHRATLATLPIHLAEVQALDRALLTQDLQLDHQVVVVRIALDHQVEEEDVVKILRK